MIEQIHFNRLLMKARFFKGFSDPVRLAILECLKEGNKSVSEISKEIGQSISNVSNHLSCLLDCGLVRSKRVGKNVYYSISMDEIVHMLNDADYIIEAIHTNMLSCVRYKDSKDR